METLTVEEILIQYERYRALVQMKPCVGNTKTFVNRIVKSTSGPAYLTQEAVDDWFIRRENESENTHYTRTCHVRTFLKFAITHGLTEIKIPEITSKWTYHPKSLVLMSEEEIQRFFKACDESYINYENSSDYIDVVTKRTIFRLLYSTGMRPNESRLLSKDDVDLKTGIVTIRETKGYHQHINVLCDSMLELMKKYDSAISEINKNRHYFFENIKGKCYTHSWLASNFSKLWHKYNSTNAVVYGFRHHYAIVNINSWIDLGYEESMDRLVTLSKSMGHSKLKHTLYYYSLVPQYAVTMKELSEKGLETIIHKLPDYEEE